MERVAVREAVREEVMLVHSGGHWDRVRATGCESAVGSFLHRAESHSHPVQTIEYLASCSEYFERLSLYVNQETAICARLSCGGVIEMCKAVAEGSIRNGFAIVRCVSAQDRFLSLQLMAARAPTVHQVITPSLKTPWAFASSTTSP